MNADVGIPFDWHGQREVELRAQCHADAPLWAKINKRAEITFMCARCGEEFLRVTAKNTLMEACEFKFRGVR